MVENWKFEDFLIRNTVEFNLSVCSPTIARCEHLHFDHTLISKRIVYTLHLPKLSFKQHEST